MSASTELAVARRSPMPDKIAYARALAESGLLPAQYRKQPANLLYAIEYGEMLGLPPMAAINGIHVIEGKPSASAALISALVRRAGHRLRITGDDKHAVCEIVRADDAEFTFRSEWTLERARAAGVAGKGVWKNYPAAMLKARALTECARDACQEALSGVMYTPEELGAYVDEEGLPVRATAEHASPADVAPPSTDRQTDPATDADAEPVAEPDWDTLIAEVERTGNITPAWKAARQHRPDDAALRERIQAAGQVRRAKPAEPAAAPAPAVDDVVDAEIVDEPPAPAGTPADAARAFLRRKCGAHGYDWDTVAARFATQYDEQLDDATDPNRITAFAKLLDGWPEHELKATPSGVPA